MKSGEKKLKRRKYRPYELKQRDDRIRLLRACILDLQRALNGEPPTGKWAVRCTECGARARHWEIKEGSAPAAPNENATHYGGASKVER
jgi:hypothetical protein